MPKSRFRQTWSSLTTGDRIALVGVAVAVAAAAPTYVVFFADGEMPSASRVRAPSAVAVRPAAQGQVEGGDAVRVADTTDGSDFANPLHTHRCDVLEYRVRLYNPGPGTLHHVRLAADINTMTRYSTIIPTVVAYSPDGAIPSTAFQPRIVLSTRETQRYLVGSTEMLDSAGNVIASSRARQMPDAITATGYGIPIGNLGIGVTEYVDFRTRLSCGQ